MSESQVVSIGGIDYDGASGQPLQKEVSVQTELRRVQSVHAKGVHAAQQRSAALNRRFVKKSIAPNHHIVKKPAGNIDVRRVVPRSPQISKFARDPAVIASKRTTTDVAPAKHPAVAKAHAAQNVQKPHTPLKAPTAAHPSAQAIKHAALGNALANAAPEPKSKKSSRGRAFNVASASLAVLMLAGYFTYINMPSLSVRVAAAQAGIDASYPEYRPIGYRLNGPIGYQSGQVSMNFASNSGPLKFSLNESRSSWDSTALLENYVGSRSNGKYATYNDGGLTIYTYGNDAAWVNNGILYTIDGTATLSNEQIRRMATSL